MGNHIGTLPHRATKSCLDVPAVRDKSPLVARSYTAARSPIQRTENDERAPGRSDIDKKIETDAQTDADLAFLMPTTVPPISVRLGCALADAFRAIRQDPMAFIGSIPE